MVPLCISYTEDDKVYFINDCITIDYNRLVSQYSINL